MPTTIMLKCKCYCMGGTKELAPMRIVFHLRPAQKKRIESSAVDAVYFFMLVP